MLPYGVRNSLFSLTNNANKINSTQQRISVGRKNLSATENTSEYFKASNYKSNIATLSGYKQNTDDALSIIKSSMVGTDSSKQILKNLRAVAIDFQSGSITKEEATLNSKDILTQYDKIVDDTDIDNVNLINGNLEFVPYDASLWEDKTSDFQTDTGITNFSATESFEYQNKLFMSGKDIDTGEFKVLEYNGENWKDTSVDTGLNNFETYEYYKYDGKVFAKGRDISSGQYKILMHDGKKFSDISVDIASDTGVLGFTSFQHMSEYKDEMFVYGWDSSGQYKALKYNGMKWENITSDLPNNDTFRIYDYTECDGSLFAFAVNDSAGNKNTILKYDGENWQDIGDETGFPDFYLRSFNETTPSGSTNIACRMYEHEGELFASNNNRQILKFNGEIWEDITLEASGTPQRDNIFAYEFRSYGKDLIMRGLTNPLNHKLMKYDGENWQDIVVDEFGSAHTNFPSYEFYEYEGDFFVGLNGNTAKYDGENWNFIKSDMGIAPGFTSSDFQEYGNGLFVNPSIWSGGGNQVFNYDGTDWRNVTADIGMTDANVVGQCEYNGKLFVSVIDTVTSEYKMLSYGDSDLADDYRVELSQDSFYDIPSKNLHSKFLDVDMQNLNFSEKGISSTIERIDNAIKAIENYEYQLSNSSNFLQTRSNFTENMTNSNKDIYDKLTILDIGEETAKMLSLQTQQSLITEMMSITQKAQSDFLTLLQK